MSFIPSTKNWFDFRLHCLLRVIAAVQQIEPWPVKIVTFAGNTDPHRAPGLLLQEGIVVDQLRNGDVPGQTCAVRRGNWGGQY